MPTPKRTTPEQQRARKAANARAYRARLRAKGKPARKIPAKRTLKGKFPRVSPKSRALPPTVEITAPKANQSPAKPATAASLDPVTGWASWTNLP